MADLRGALRDTLAEERALEFFPCDTLSLGEFIADLDSRGVVSLDIFVDLIR